LLVGTRVVRVHHFLFLGLQRAKLTQPEPHSEKSA
jgi:hypothetical protein